jgi:hypothetical protein
MFFAGCMVVPQTYDPGRLHPVPGIHAFIPDSYRSDTRVTPPAVTVLVDSTGGDLEVSVYSWKMDYRRVRVLADECSLTDASGNRYRLGPFISNSYENKAGVGESYWVSYETRAYGPLPSGGLHKFYGEPHTLRVVYAEDGRRYTAAQEFAATYPLITIFDVMAWGS